MWDRIRPAPLDLREETKKVLDLLSTVAREKEICLSLQLDSSDELWIVYADEQLLGTVLRNLITNALKFTPPRGRVTVAAAHPRSKFIEVSVADTGMGISAVDQAKLLEIGAHHTTRGTNGEVGTGLGLTICREMVRRWQGEIWLESELGQGTIVRFTVPVPTDAINTPVGLNQP